MTLPNGKCNHVCVMYNKVCACPEPNELHHLDFGWSQKLGTVTTLGTSPASSFAFLTCISWSFVISPQRKALRQHSKKTVSRECKKPNYSICLQSGIAFGLFNGKGCSILGGKKSQTFLQEKHVCNMLITDSQFNQHWQRFKSVKHSSQTPWGLIYATGQPFHIMSFPHRGSHLLLLSCSRGKSEAQLPGSAFNRNKNSKADRETEETYGSFVHMEKRGVTASILHVVAIGAPQKTYIHAVGSRNPKLFVHILVLRDS